MTCYATRHGHDPEEGKTPYTAATYGVVARAAARAGAAAGAHWVPDLRDPKVRADLRRQAKLMAQHPENDAIDAWNEAAYDWDAWK